MASLVVSMASECVKAPVVINWITASAHALVQISCLLYIQGATFVGYTILLWLYMASPWKGSAFGTFRLHTKANLQVWYQEGGEVVQAASYAWLYICIASVCLYSFLCGYYNVALPVATVALARQVLLLWTESKDKCGYFSQVCHLCRGLWLEGMAVYSTWNAQGREGWLVFIAIWPPAMTGALLLHGNPTVNMWYCSALLGTCCIIDGLPLLISCMQLRVREPPKFHCTCIVVFACAFSLGYLCNCLWYVPCCVAGERNVWWRLLFWVLEGKCCSCCCGRSVHARQLPHIPSVGCFLLRLWQHSCEFVTTISQFAHCTDWNLFTCCARDDVASPSNCPDIKYLQYSALCESQCLGKLL